MTIAVSGPQGVTVNFPDGTDSATISSVMQQNFGGSAAPAGAGDMSADNLVRSAAQGIPVVGGLADRFAAGMDALTQPLLGRGSAADTLAERYSQNAANQQAQTNAFDTQHPVASIGAGVVGGVGALGALAKTAAGAKLLGLTGQTLPQQMLQGAASGYAMNAADAITRGQDPATAGQIGAALGGAAPVAGRAVGALFQGAKNAIAPASNPIAGDLGVILSQGQRTGDIGTAMTAQQARTGALGPAAQAIAEKFDQQQAGSIQSARDAIATQLNPAANIAVETPQDAAQIAGNAVQQKAAQLRTNYQTAYQQAENLPGQIAPEGMAGVSDKIAAALPNLPKPVQLNPTLTPNAVSLLGDLKKLFPAIEPVQSSAEDLPIAQRNNFDTGALVAKLRAAGVPEDVLAKQYGAALPAAAAAPSSMKDVAQGGRLITPYYQAAKAAAARGGGSAEDLRAVGAIGQLYRDHVTDAVDSKLFSGSDQVLPELKKANALFSQYKQTFNPQGPGDEVGRTIQKILGRYDGQAATPPEVANYLYGSAQISGAGLPVRVAARVKSILGENSPEWQSVRQGMWRRLVEPTDGIAEMTPKKQADRIYNFVNGNGRPLAQSMFSDEERSLMSRYATVMRQLEPKAGTVNNSGTAQHLMKLGSKYLGMIGALVGEHLGGPVGAIAGFGMSKGAEHAGGAFQAAKAANAFYGSPERTAASMAAKLRAANRASIGVRGAVSALPSRSQR